jgi:hypothetical protein
MVALPNVSVEPSWYLVQRYPNCGGNGAAVCGSGGGGTGLWERRRRHGFGGDDGTEAEGFGVFFFKPTPPLRNWDPDG